MPGVPLFAVATVLMSDPGGGIGKSEGEGKFVSESASWDDVPEIEWVDVDSQNVESLAAVDVGSLPPGEIHAESRLLGTAIAADRCARNLAARNFSGALRGDRLIVAGGLHLYF